MHQEALKGPYADYGYYSKIFCGTAIPVTKYQKYAGQATAFIDRITFGRVQRLPDIPREVKDAACAVAEVGYEAGKQSSNIKSENIDGYAVTYGDADTKTKYTEMYNAAAAYLASTGLMYKGRSRKYDNKC